MALHNDNENKAVPHRFEINGSNGDIVTLKALWIKTYNNGSIDVGCDLDDDSAKIYALGMLDGKLRINFESPLPMRAVDNVVTDPDVDAGDAVIDNVGFFSYNEIVRYVQNVRLNNIKLIKSKPNRDTPSYDTPESLRYLGEYNSGLKNRGAKPGELLCVLAHLYGNLTEEEMSDPVINAAIIEMTDSTISILADMVRNISIPAAYFGDSVDTVMMYIKDNNYKALNSISNIWKSGFYAPVDIKPIFAMYETLAKQKEKEEQMKDEQEIEDKKKENREKIRLENERKEKVRGGSGKNEEKNSTFFKRNKKTIIIAGVASVAVIGFGLFKALSSSDTVVIVD